MKSMTCKQLGGACDKIFQAETFDEIAALSKAHGREMFMAKDAAHLLAMDKMKEVMNTPGAFQKWLIDKQAEFDALGDDE